MASGDNGDPYGAGRGLFQVIVSAAEEHADTATVWQRFQDAATNFARATVNSQFGSAATEEQVQAAYSQLTSGFGIQQMNYFRGLAGQYLQAKQNAMARGSEQFQAEDIFTAPWSQSVRTGGAVRQYRANITFRSTFAGVNGPVELEETRSYFIGPTLTNGDQLGEAARSWYGKLPYNTRLSDTEVVDYALEAV